MDVTELAWYAISTHPRHEKKVYSLLLAKEVIAYLPTYSKVHRWRNGVSATVELPLFPGYLFVRIDLRDRLKILQSPGISCFVAFGGLPAEIPEFEIERLRCGFTGLRPEPHPYLDLGVGDMVVVKSGPLAGMQGIVVNKKNETRIVISMDLLMRAISVEVDPANLEHVVRPPETLAAGATSRIPTTAYTSAFHL